VPKHGPLEVALNVGNLSLRESLLRDRELTGEMGEIDARASGQAAKAVTGPRQHISGTRRSSEIALQRDDDDENGATIWMRAMRRCRTAGRA
jgi:hypothetical protein